MGAFLCMATVRVSMWPTDSLLPCKLLWFSSRLSSLPIVANLPQISPSVVIGWYESCPIGFSSRPWLVLFSYRSVMEMSCEYVLLKIYIPVPSSVSEFLLGNEATCHLQASLSFFLFLSNCFFIQIFV